MIKHIVSPFRTNFVGISKSVLSRMIHHKVTIIGSGPAAHTAAIYLARAEMKPTLYEGMMANGIAAGGQLTTTTDIENFPGFPESLSGSELMERMRKQSAKFGTNIITETVSKVDLSSKPFRLWTEFNEDAEPVTTDAIILATGASAKRMHLPGEETYWQQGISACAVCDGAVPIFRNKPLAVIGGGDSACEEAEFLTKYASKVYILVRKDHFRASAIMQRRIEKNPNIIVLFNTVALEAKGDGKLLNMLRIKNTKSNVENDLEVNGLFYAIGHSPATDIVKGQVDEEETGYIKTVPGSSLTSVPGFFAAGDVQDSRYRQAVTSAGSGCIAALDAERYLSAQE
ncbi:CPA_1a_G0024560.mRNA.1.CDS.1 [Saccharomyces cerevisiae]|nr:CPA_1a_G0024560.mRNA.1.CDS.1 [Saccharomyces cerevisiae]CAI4513612.1 CPI_1c_G0024300.mRNA.1.CDS.1 [Saccharomyces cerevisiae]CAI4522923.1 BBM_1a_G0024280.mRNA.1.CDS.1 [Saccharomyces cerevisiae]CAI7152354.1 BBM_1a_G0024280.mRNA.1.CDS.1 [Saccharomyces cerevisiae]CAI7334371.1 CPI_1c_G0024300.mRNA.1.CDS.1 [Saccharomyces cerevisiae]